VKIASVDTFKILANVKNEFKFLLFQQFVQHRHRNLGWNSNYAIVKTKVLGPKQSMQGAFLRTSLQKGMTNNFYSKWVKIIIYQVQRFQILCTTSNQYNFFLYNNRDARNLLDCWKIYVQLRN
jgi:hypothetical protein